MDGHFSVHKERREYRESVFCTHPWYNNRDSQPLSRFAGRYGKIDVFYFDFYSIALSKIDRGNARDLQDVALLIQQGIVALADLNQAAQEVAAQMGKGSYKRLDAQDFLTRYQAIRPHLQI